jgi:hypothetical protein
VVRRVHDYRDTSGMAGTVHEKLSEGTAAFLTGCRTAATGCATNRHPMEDQMLARAAVPRAKRRCVEFRSTRSPRDLLISLPVRQPWDGARVAVTRTTAPRNFPMQHGR